MEVIYTYSILLGNRSLSGTYRNVCKITWSRSLLCDEGMRSRRPILPARNLFLMTEARLMLTAPDMWHELNENTGLQSNTITLSCMDNRRDNFLSLERQLLHIVRLTLHFDTGAKKNYTCGYSESLGATLKSPSAEKYTGTAVSFRGVILGVIAPVSWLFPKHQTSLIT